MGSLRENTDLVYLLILPRIITQPIARRVAGRRVPRTAASAVAHGNPRHLQRVLSAERKKQHVVRTNGTELETKAVGALGQC